MICTLRTRAGRPSETEAIGSLGARIGATPWRDVPAVVRGGGIRDGNGWHAKSLGLTTVGDGGDRLTRRRGWRRSHGAISVGHSHIRGGRRGGGQLGARVCSRGGERRGGRHQMVWTSLCDASSACAGARARASRSVGAGGGRHVGLRRGAAALVGGGRDQVGVHDGRSSATAVLTGRKGVSVCGGARRTSIYGEACGERRVTSIYGEAARRSVVVVGSRHSMMARSRCVGGRGSAPLKQEAEAHAVYLSLGGACIKHEEEESDRSSRRRRG